MKYIKKLVGERIYLSPQNVEDYEKYAEWLNDFCVTDYTGRSYRMVSLERAKEMISTPKDECVQMAIVQLSNDELIGQMGLYEINSINRTATLGIFIGNDKFRNNGYGTEAIKLLLDFGFNYLNLNNINLDVIEFNERAIKCYQKCGFKEYGRRKQSKFINGKYYDTVEMEILAKEFNSNYIKNKNI